MEVYFWNNRRAICGCIHISCDVTPEAQAWLPTRHRSWNKGARLTCPVEIKMADDPSFSAVTLLFLAAIRRRVCPWNERKCCYVTAKFLPLRHRKLNNAIDWQGSLLLIHVFCVRCARVCVTSDCKVFGKAGRRYLLCMERNAHSQMSIMLWNYYLFVVQW
jgi:hypothetical protein